MCADCVCCAPLPPCPTHAQIPVAFAQAAYLLYTNCTSYPSRVLWFYLIYIITIFLLFNDFSNKTYKKTADKKKN